MLLFVQVAGSPVIPARCAAVTAAQSVTPESFARISSRTSGVRSHIAIGVLCCASTVQVFAVAPSAGSHRNRDRLCLPRRHRHLVTVARIRIGIRRRDRRRRPGRARHRRHSHLSRPHG